MLTRTFFNRAPLVQTRFAPLPVGAVCAKGALRDRLLSLRAELLSRCASLCPQAGKESVWFGGNLPCGRQAADLLDAMLTVSALLEDQDMRAQAIGLALRAADSQRDDGSFGAEDASFADRGAMLRALKSAYSLSGEKRLLTFMLRYMKFLKDELPVHPLSHEDALHTADTLEAGVFLYNITGQKAILPVLTMLIAQGADYTSLFHTFPYRTPVTRTISAASLEEALSQEDENGYYHHLLRTASAQNLCEGLRTAALSGLVTGSGKHLSAPEVGLTRMMKAHGTPGGAPSGTPLLAGRNPAAGAAAASLCQMADSLGLLLSSPDGEHFADQLETLVYNGMYAAFAPDGRGVQKIQQANQTRISRDPRFDMANEDANLFTCDDAQTLCALLSAVPRFAQAQWLLSRDGGLCVMGYAPCSVRYRLGDAGVRLDVSGDYPRSGAVRMTLHLNHEAAFPIHLRIPAWAEGATAAVSGDVYQAEAGKFLTINRQWHDDDEILLNLPMTIERIDSFHQSVSVVRGPLRFVYAPGHEASQTQEGYALMNAKDGAGIALRADAAFELVETEDGVALKTRAVLLPRWKMTGVSCPQPPIVLDETGEEVDVLLVPYADAPIRLAVLPQA